MRYKLIIFDLDDTLVDTAGSIGPLKLFDALQVMVEAGLKISSLNEAYKLLKKIDSTSPSGKETIKLFLAEIKAKDDFLTIGVKEYYENIRQDFTMSALEDATEILIQLKAQYHLALVSIGIESQQFLKMKKANLDPRLFDRIFIVQENSKKQWYEQLQREFSCLPEEVLVCGDRFTSDLQPAQELGFKTVHMRWGRGLKQPIVEKVDYTIEKLKELLPILDSV